MVAAPVAADGRSGAATVRRLLPDVLAALAVALGVTLRVRQFAGRRSLWMDEASVAVNIVGRGFSALLRPLGGEQAAPPGWLWAERLSIRVLGVGEQPLRLPQLLAGCAVLVLVWLLARRLLGAGWAWVPVLLAALSPDLAYYSNEVKPYELDAALTLLVLLLAVRALDRGLRRAALLAWSAVSAVAVVLSWATIVTVGTTAVILLTVALSRPSRSRLRATLLAQLPWVASLGWEYLAVLRAVGRNPALRGYWSHGYPSGWTDVPGWTALTLRDLVSNPLHLSSVPVTAALVAAGAAVLLRGWGRSAAALVLLVPAALAAGALHAYPVQARASLFLVAPVLLLACAPLLLAGRLPDMGRVPRGATAARRLAPLATAGLLAVAVASGALATAGTLRHTTAKTESRPVLQQVARLVRPGDAVFLQAFARPAYAYYSAPLGLPPGLTVLVAPSPEPCRDAATLRARAPSGRVWLLLTEVPGREPDRDARYAARFERLGRVLHRFTAPAHVLAVEVDLDEPPSGAPPPVALPGGCLAVGGAVAGVRRPAALP